MCTVSETESTASTQDYIAYVGNDTSLFPPNTIVATSNDQSVVWQSVTAGGTAFPTMDLPGEMITALGTASADVGPSPFYIEIFDVTTGTLVIACGSGQLCTDSSVSESSDTTQEYITVVAHYSSTFPPTGIQATSPLHSCVTWTDTGLTLSLNGESVYNHGTFRLEVRSRRILVSLGNVATAEQVRSLPPGSGGWTGAGARPPRCRPR